MKRLAVLAFAIAILIFSVVMLSSNPATIVLPEEPDELATAAFTAQDTFETYDDDDDHYEPIETHETTLTLAFSETEHFHAFGVTVEITASVPGARIYYTLDGSIPTTNSTQYFQPLEFPQRTGIQTVVLRAIAVYGNMVSRPLTHTYFIGLGINSRFDTLVFSLSTTPEYLFDHYVGILVPGITREEFIRDNPRRHINPPDPANFNWRGREGERPINVEIFTPDGQRVISQAAGVRVFGAWSRAYDQKSLRLIARREYEPTQGRFHFDFFPGDITLDGYEIPITAYNALILRNGGNDRNFGMLRNEVGSVLVRNAGVAAVTPVRPVAIFLNGEYYGFAWLQTRIDAHYLAALYNAPTREFDIINSGEWWFTSGTEEARADIVAKNNFAFRNLQDDAIFAELEALVDIDNLLFYYAFQIFMGNEDWPHNNLRRWRYTGEQVPGLAPELDGRWRYAFFDLDWTLGLYGDDFRKPTLRNVLTGNEPRSQILSAILTRQDMAERFMEIMYDIAINIVTGHTVHDAIEYLYGLAFLEINYALAAGKYAHWTGLHTIQENHRNMVNFAVHRGDFILNELENFFSHRFP